MDSFDQAGQAFANLCRTMAKLRDPKTGCAWDQQQTHASLKEYLLEETYEVLEAIDDAAPELLQEELGDLLFQVVFHSEIAQSHGQFDVSAVVSGINDKLVRRHPHVFVDPSMPPPDWHAAKQAEKGRKSALDGVPRGLPSLLRALRVTEKAARLGFDWPDPSGPREKIDEELDEVRQALNENSPQRVADEIGDLLFSVVNYARHLKIEPEDALAGAIKRFSSRFRHVESDLAAEGKQMSDTPLDALESLWEDAKLAE